MDNKEKNNFKIRVITSGLILFVIVFTFIFSIYTTKEKIRNFNFILFKQSFGENEIVISKPIFNIADNLTYSFFESDQLGFGFEYPNNWQIQVNLSKDRENYIDRVIITNFTGDFRIYINSFSSFNPHYSKIEEYIQANNLPYNPFYTKKILFNSDEFIFINNFEEPLLLSKNGGYEIFFDKENQSYIVFDSLLILGKRGFVYQQRGENLSRNIILGQPDYNSVNAQIFHISYEVVNNVPWLVWYLNKDILIRILFSLRVIEKNLLK